MNNRVEVLVPDCRQDFELDSVIFQLSRRNIVRAAIHGDIVAAQDQPSREMFCEGFKAAVAGGDTSRSENSNAHQFKIVKPRTAPLPGKFAKSGELYLAR